jgi:hypothetical protein
MSCLPLFFYLHASFKQYTFFRRFLLHLFSCHSSYLLIFSSVSAFACLLPQTSTGIFILTCIYICLNFAAIPNPFDYLSSLLYWFHYPHIDFFVLTAFLFCNREHAIDLACPILFALLFSPAYPYLSLPLTCSSCCVYFASSAALSLYFNICHFISSLMYILRRLRLLL